MRPLAAVERFFERIFERPTARLFGAHLQPVQLQRRLERAMEDERLSGSGGRVLVPNRYAIRLHPDDLSSFDDLAPELAAELADACLAYARQHHYTLSDRPQVALVPDDDVSAGEIRVAGAFAGRETGAGRAAGQEAPEPGTSAGGGQPGGSPAAEGEGPFGPPPAQVADRTMVFEVPQVRAPRALLRLVQPDGQERQIVADGRPLTLGRSPDNDVVIRDSRASRHHARLQARSGSLILSDLGSTNGTRVNGSPITEVALGVGDRIAIGDSVMVVDSAPDADA